MYNYEFLTPFNKDLPSSYGVSRQNAKIAESIGISSGGFIGRVFTEASNAYAGIFQDSSTFISNSEISDYTL